MKQYADVVLSLDDKMHIPVINLWGPTLGIKVDTTINSMTDLIDGLDLSKTGYKKLFLAIKAMINAKFPGLVPTNSYFGPYYRSLQNISTDHQACKQLIENAGVL